MKQLPGSIKKQPIFWMVFLFIFAVSFTLFPGEIKYTKNPEPTHVEKNFVKLVKVHRISPDIDDEHFMARPFWITVDGRGNMFVLDIMLRQVFKFDKNYRFVKTFGRKGQGPGEFGGLGSFNRIYAAKDGCLYVSADMNRKIIQFDSDGKHIRDIRIPLSTHPSAGFVPLVGPAGIFYVPSEKSCGIEVLDRRMNKLYTLLNKDAYNRSFILKVSKRDSFVWTTPDMLNTFCDFGAGDQLIVYLANSSTVYIYKGSKLLNKFDVRPKLALEIYKRRIDKKREKLRENDIFILYIFINFFVDKDDENFFFLERRGEGKKRRMLYKFDIEGKLVRIYHSPFTVRFLAKRNHLFYGIHKDHIYILKEAKE